LYVGQPSVEKRRVQVIHWTQHRSLDRILGTGLVPQKRELLGGKSVRGIWCYPLAPGTYQSGYWRRVLKARRQGNYNGLVFRLEAQDFPLLAGCWSTQTSLAV
jgi:hypothetical protein